MIDIYDADGQVSMSKVQVRINEILRRTQHGLSVYQRNDLAELIKDAAESVPADHECIGDDEAEHNHSVYVWERLHGKNRGPVELAPWMADTDPGYDNGMTGPVM